MFAPVFYDKSSTISTRAAKEARITNSDLAERLDLAGQALTRLSERHADFLDSFGYLGTVPRSVRCGNGFRTVTEPTYNRQQVLYLISKSETERANSMTCASLETRLGGPATNKGRDIARLVGRNWRGLVNFFLTCR